jgi:predicted dithiol-disulfide oxidoreductase (DUF899 family)
MAPHRTGTEEEWRTASRELLEREKTLTRESDELARARRELPWVRVEREYAFDTDAGRKTLPELFAGRSQLLVYHFMFAPGVHGWPDAGCDGCSMIADHFDGPMAHLNQRDVTLVCASRAPLDKLQAYKRRMGWRFDWVSCEGDDFNRDFGVTFTEEDVANGAEFNFRPVREPGEYPGLSAFALQDSAVHRTYSFYDRGGDPIMSFYQLLDRAPKGRDEDDLPFPQAWWQRHDEYAEVRTGDA